MTARPTYPPPCGQSTGIQYLRTKNSATATSSAKMGSQLVPHLQNMQEIKFAKLAPRWTNSSVPHDPRDWGAVPSCMSINGATCTPGSSLIDTGVAQSYMTLPFGTIANRTIFPLLDNGSTVDVQFGSSREIVACEKFIVGDAEGIQKGVVPSFVRLSLADPVKNPPYVNTGSHFLRRWKLAFDAVGGELGFAPV